MPRIAPVRRPAALALLLTLSLFTGAALTGCAAVAVGTVAGVTIQAYRGDSRGMVPASQQTLTDATNVVFDSLDIGIDTVDRTENDTVIITGYSVPNGRKITVTLVHRGEETTQMSVRVGLMGDEPASTAIFTRIVRAAGIEAAEPAE